MIFSFSSIRRARRKMLDPLWPVRVFRHHLDSRELLKLGLRLAAYGTRLALVAFVAGVCSDYFAGLRSVCDGFIWLSVLGAYTALAGKLACLATPVGRRWVGFHWLALLLSLPATALTGEPGGIGCWLASSILFLIFFGKLVRHFRLDRTVHHFHLALGLYMMGAALPLFTVAMGELSETACLLSVAMLLSGLALYTRCLMQASHALPASEKPFRPSALARDLVTGCRDSWRRLYHLSQAP